MKLSLLYGTVLVIVFNDLVELNLLHAIISGDMLEEEILGNINEARKTWWIFGAVF
jgi:hypothetical protein